MKVLFYGDSNTFGYDPRSYLDSRYAPENRWVDIVAAQTGWDVVNAGQNGREIPHRSFELSAAQELFCRHNPDLTVIMLGTNDLLQGTDPETVTERMAAFLQSFTGKVFLVAPPPLQRGAWVTEDALVEASRQLGGLYQRLSLQLGIAFADAAQWIINLTFDGVHFSEEGHRSFARHLLKKLV